MTATDNGKTFDVEISLGLDPATGVISATFQSIDPNTQLPPDLLTGFLPPEDGTGRGMGYFPTYIVQPKAGGLATGTQIRNVAVVTFDANPAITTDQVNDDDPSQGTDPTRMEVLQHDRRRLPSPAGVGPLPPTETTTNITVSWSGSDDMGGSGIAAYNCLRLRRRRPVRSPRTNTTETSATSPTA